MASVGRVAQLIEEWAPKSWACEWDNVGLQVGDPGAKIKKVLVCLDVTAATVKEAVNTSSGLICSHHPLLFKGMRTINLGTPAGALLGELIKNDIAVYSAHTNLDVAPGGVEDTLTELLELTSVEVLNRVYKDKLYKVVVFVPRGYEDAVRDAMAGEGAGWIGNYSHCTFQAAGTGTFKPLEGSNPFIGTQGRVEMVDEFRLETIVPEGILKKVISAMLKAHPYEEVAYDIYELENEGNPLGLGRVGVLKKGVSLPELVDYVKARLGCPAPKVVAGGSNEVIVRVATACGSGSDQIEAAVRAGAQAIVTGDVRYHDALRARAEGLSVIDAGHFYTERAIVPKLAQYLRDKLGKELEVIESGTAGDVFGIEKSNTSKSLEIHVDGASSGNPGRAGIGLIIESVDGSRLEKSLHIGLATNNVAEYTAIVEALRTAEQLGATAVRIYSDSELVINQLNGKYTVRNPELQRLRGTIESISRRFDRVEFIKVPREENRVADALAKAATRNEESVSTQPGLVGDES